MKKRSRSRRGRMMNRFPMLESLGSPQRKQRRHWTFEQLEERHMLSADGGAGSADFPLPTDPYFTQGYLWQLLNVGQLVNYDQNQDIFGVAGEDINVVPAWAMGYTGEGILIAVVDTGVQVAHPDLNDNISDIYRFNILSGGTNVNPGGDDAGAAHGTAVAGLIAEEANNGIGGVGVAYGATIVPVRLLPSSFADPIFTEQDVIDAILLNGAPVDILNHSWGPSDATREAFGLSDDLQNRLQDSAINGRDGLGQINVWASGNGNGYESYTQAGIWDSAWLDGYVSSRYTIGVGAVDHDGSVYNDPLDGGVFGIPTMYSETGPGVLIVAPSGSFPIDIVSNPSTGSGVWTTDLLGDDGINAAPFPSGQDPDDDHFDNLNPDDTDSNNYTSIFNGTSGAAPLVSGVVALMLEADMKANNGQQTLSYRDVEEILVRSARQNDKLDDSWIVNGQPLFRDPVPTQYGGYDTVAYYAIQEIATPKNPPPDPPDPGMDPEDPNDYEWILHTQATTGPVVAANTGFIMVADPQGSIYGAAGNGVTVTFDFGAPVVGTVATFTAGTPPLIPDNIHIEVQDETVTWGDIATAVTNAVGSPGNFLLLPENPSATFNPADAALVLTFSGGGAGPIFNPVGNPVTTFQPQPLYTNGAGYTVSHGWLPEYATDYGYAHGVVDAGLAVQMASVWNDMEQTLAPEITQVVALPGFTDLPAVETIDEDNGDYAIPGGLGGDSGFADFFNEFFEDPDIEEPELDDDPMNGIPDGMPIEPATLSAPFGGEDPPQNSRGISLTIPGPDMAVEWVEAEFTIEGGDLNGIDFLRITLVSPDGTHSDLTNWVLPDALIDNNFQAGTQHVSLFVDPPGTVAGEEAEEFRWTYGTNRSWGERGDGVWQLVFENYSDQAFRVGDFSITFSGKPLGGAAAAGGGSAGTLTRVTGQVGVDAGFEGNGALDGSFNYNPLTDTEFSRNQQAVEPYASMVLVYAIDNATGEIVDQHLTGADGNYYFDLPDGMYTIGFQDLDDPANPRSISSVNPAYMNDVVITIDSVNLPPPSPVNFLLDPLEVPDPEVIFEGNVYADLDGNGTVDPQDVAMPGFIAFADLNHTGLLEAGEPFVVTDVDGHYSLQVDDVFFGTTFTIGIKPLEDWSPTNPTNGLRLQFAEPRVDEFGLPIPYTGIDFLFQPPSEPSGEGNGTIIGFVFNDKNGDGVQQANESGFAGRMVFIDEDLSGDHNGSEPITVTNAGGAFKFFDITPGVMNRIDVVVQEPFTKTTPALGYFDVTLEEGEVATNLKFGIRNEAVYDFGDLYDTGLDYDTTGPDAAASLAVPGFSLGPTVDAEIRSGVVDSTTMLQVPALDGIGDDVVDVATSKTDDEDGVTLVDGIVTPGINEFLVSVLGVGGYLNAWFDWNNDGDFDDTVDGVPEHALVNVHLNDGTYSQFVTAPATLTPGTQVKTRWRWGDIDLGPSGLSLTAGEVEDHIFMAGATVSLRGDYNGDGTVNAADYSVWRTNKGLAVVLPNDVTPGTVDQSDYMVWRNHYGETMGGGAGAGSEPPAEQTASAAHSEPAPEPSYAPTQSSVAPESDPVLPPVVADPTPVTVVVPEPVIQEPVVVPEPVVQEPVVVLQPVVQEPVVSKSVVTEPVLTPVIVQTVIDSPVLEVLAPQLDASQVSVFSLTGSVGSFSLESESLASTRLVEADALLLDRVLDDIGRQCGDDSADDDSRSLLPKDEDADDAELVLAALFDDEQDWLFGA